MMDRLNFRLPDFTRTSWVSDPARAIWEPRLGQIVRTWQDIEWLSVVAGLRPCCVTLVAPHQLVEQAGKWVEHGLNLLPVEMQGAPTSPYASTSSPVQPGRPFLYRIVVGSPADVLTFKQAWEAGDNEAVGTLLGYPACCLTFFREAWVDQGMVDTTWPMALANVSSPDGARCLEASGPPEANILWRWLNVRAVPHLPCRFDCPATARFGRQMIDLGRQHGYDQEMEWLLEILSWPVEWSALHGIAEIKTPILKISTMTDATATKYTVQRPGERYPAEGAQGVQFPYRQPARPGLTRLNAYQRGMAQPIEPAAPTFPDWYASDNGFTSRLAMDRGHQPIVDLALQTLAGQAGNVLDLGCGNGALLKKIYEANQQVVPFGLEFKERTGRVDHARLLLPDFAANFMAGNMFESELPWAEGRRYDLVILMPGRLLEVKPEQTAWLRAKLRDYAGHLLIYAYGDWLARHGNLANLARQAGLIPQDAAPNASACLARID